MGELDLLRLQTAMGFTAEDLDLVIEDMAGLGKEPTFKQNCNWDWIAVRFACSSQILA